MAVDLYIAPDLQDAAIGADQKRGAKNAMEGLSVHRFFAPNAVRLQHLVLLVRNERCDELVLVPKRLLGLWRVGGNTEHGGLGFGKSVRKPREVDRLPGAARRVGARIEKQHELLARIIGQRNGAAAIARQTELGRFRPFRQSGLCNRRDVGRAGRRLWYCRLRRLGFRSRRGLGSCRPSRSRWFCLARSALLLCRTARSSGRFLPGFLAGLSGLGRTGLPSWRFGGFRWCSAGGLAGCRLRGFLTRFLGHTPSFRRFRRINQ